MAKNKKSSKPAMNQASKENGGSTIMFAVIVVVIVMAVFSLYAMGNSGSSGGGVNTAGNNAGGPDISSLESQVKTLTEQVNKDPKDASLHEDLGTALFNLANAYRDTNNPKANEILTQTIKVYNETLQLEPNSKETLGDLATAYFYSNQVDQAITTVEKALKIDPGFVPALLNYGIYLANGKGDTKNAIKQWEKVPVGSPQYDQAKQLIEQYK